MSEMWLEDLPVELADYEDSDLDTGEDAGDDLEWDAESDEESRASRRRRARILRARRIAAARRRRAQLRRRGGAGGRPNPASDRRPVPAAAALREVDLQSKVADDDLRLQLAGVRKSMTLGQYAAVAGVGANQVVQSFGQSWNPWARAALGAAPLALLSPQKRSEGVGGLVSDPRFIGIGLVLGITFAGERWGKAKIDVNPPDEIKVNTGFKLNARVVSGGNVQPARVITWRSEDKTIADFPARDDVLQAGGTPGNVEIVGTSPDVPDFRKWIRVVP